MKIHTLQKFAVLSAIGLCFTGSAMATVLVNDTFSSGTANSNGYYGYNTPGGTLWTVTTGMLQNADGSAPNTVMNKSFTPTTLSAVGDSITLQYDFRNLQQSTVAGNMEIGLYNVGSTISANSIGGTNPLTNKAGWTLLQNNNEQVLYLNEKTTSGTNVGHGTWWNGRTDLIPSPLVVPWVSTSNSTGMVTNTMTLTMTAGGLQISSTTAGNNMPTYLAAGVMTFTVDTISIFDNYGGGSGSRYSLVDNVIVTAVPEPATWALLALSLTTVMVLRRRRA